MTTPKTPPSVLKSATRLLGWALLIGGLVLSLFADSISGLGSLSETLQGFGFPAGTLCVAGFLLLTLASVVQKEEPFESVPSQAPAGPPSKRAESAPASADIRELQERLISELERRHEGIKDELQEMSARLEARLGENVESEAEWSLAAGAELTPRQHQLGPRRLGPKPLSNEPRIEEPDDEELEMTLEIEEQTPDEARLWRQHAELVELGDLEDRLSGDVSVDPKSFVWDFPQGDKRTDQPREIETPAEEPQTEAAPSFDPPSDTENISWFDWDDEDLV